MNETRRLSPWRVILALLLLAGLSYGTFLGWGRWQEKQSVSSKTPWFAPYVDVTATPLYPFEQLGQASSKNAVLSFIVSSPLSVCSPSWGGVYTLDKANSELDLDRRIARLHQLGGDVAISFGGQKNQELALNCSDPDKLQASYQLVIDQYNIDTIDLDLEGEGLTNIEAGKRRAKALAAVQKKQRAEKKNLAIWLTLPVTPQGLTPDGTNAISQMLASGVDLAGINAMTMDYGASKGTESMAEASQKALNETHRQLGVLYTKAGINLSSTTLWGKIGATPMIGQNDVIDEIFTPKDAESFNQFGIDHRIGRMSMWSANRDIQCGDNYVDIKIVSESCSGVKQDKLNFTNALSLGFGGELSKSAVSVTKDDPNANIQKPDDPGTSPYEIWQESARYLEGTKVVWHKNVYLAKWWTQGNLPDNPVLQSWETPWQLVGPVLPGERPIPQPTLKPGIYPAWSGTTEYIGGERVLFNGLPYQAKWWTKGDSPAASSAVSDNSPWLPLTKTQINELLEQN